MLIPDPRRVLVDGRPTWLFADGTRLPVISGGSDDDGAPPPPPPPPPGDGGQDDDDPPAFQAPKDQAEFDRMVRARIQRERQKYADYDDLKTKATQFDELQRQSESETERLRREAQEAEARATAASWQLAETAIRSAVVAEAAKAGAVDPDAVVALLDRDAVTIDDAGRVTGADTAVKELLEMKPYLKGQAPPPPSFDSGARGNGTGGNGSVQQIKSRDELRGKTPEEIVALRESGALDELMGRTTH